MISVRDKLRMHGMKLDALIEGKQLSTALFSSSSGGSDAYVFCLDKSG